MSVPSQLPPDTPEPPWIECDSSWVLRYRWWEAPEQWDLVDGEFVPARAGTLPEGMAIMQIQFHKHGKPTVTCEYVPCPVRLCLAFDEAASKGQSIRGLGFWDLRYHLI